MTSDSGKENIADGLLAGPAFTKAPSLSPRKSARKTRSKSIGPGGVDSLDEPALKESNGNRRKSAFVPAVKSILASNDEDEKKRRRKSLARRRVSFAPEATLHTWDVVEYLRDATSSSASSDATRRASAVSQPPTPAHDASDEERPATPPENVDEPAPEPESSPANQRDLHQKKYRRSSGIPPMNFNNPDDLDSSSPLSGDDDSPAAATEDTSDSGGDDGETARIDGPHDESSARLDAALRQASAHAGTQRLQLGRNSDDDDDEDDDDISMDVVEDDVTTSFKPWAKKSSIPSFEDQENIYPSLPVPSPDASDEEDDGEDMSMDITRAIGTIVQQRESPSSDLDDISMDLTMPLGSIKATNLQQQSRRQNLKRRASLVEPSQGSPAKRPANRRTSLRQRSLLEVDSPAEDATMDFTVALGTIKSKTASENPSPARINGADASDDETMDFTVAIGSIRNVQKTNNEEPESDPVDGDDDDEEMSMEFTRVIGGIKNFNKLASTPEKPTSPVVNAPTKTKTPTPNKSPSRLELEESNAKRASPSLQKAEQSTPQRSPGRPHKSIATTPTFPPPSEQIERFEPSPFVRLAPTSISGPNEAFSTPTNKPQHFTPTEISDDPMANPLLNRRRSSLSLVQFSPLSAARNEPVLKSTAALSNNIKLLSTPRKQTLLSPMKRGLTPKKSQSPKKAPTPKQKTPTPKKQTPRESVSPRKRVAFGVESPAKAVEENKIDDESREGVELISLQEFLDMTKIRFMELSTTKRRHTAAPTAFYNQEVEEKEETLDRYVVAATCTLPEYELYQHACHEMKKFISDGRHFVRTMEANVLEENPLLFSEYLTAPPDQRSVMDNQFKNLKTSARLDAREQWYNWRSTLLQNLKVGLLDTMDGFMQDESVLNEQEKLLDAVLPPLTKKHGLLSTECKQLQQRHDDLNSCVREELEEVREQLVAEDAELEETRRLVAQVQRELSEKEARIEAVKERKIECVEEIKAAERVREQFRGWWWSTSEVNDLKVKVQALEHAHDWSIISASSTTVTMTHLNDLELYFQPSAFATGASTPNAPISLTYVGDCATPHARPLTTSKRFFLQLIRAHLHCIPQSQTRIAELLALVKEGWAAALSVAEGVRWLGHNYITDECILSDERMAISANMLLPTLQSKVRCTIEISVSLGPKGAETHVEYSAELVYGEKYKVEKMGAFLKDVCGEHIRDKKDMAMWANGVMDLAMRLKATGRKGERA